MDATNLNSMRDGWFSELNDLWPGVALSLQVEEVLHHERSQYQELLVVRTKSHGRALMLDGVIQCTEKDEFSYHEMIAFLPLCCHPNPKHVLVVGGGDGGTIREVIKHQDVERVTLVEIDNRVIEVSKEYLPSISLSFDNPKVNVIIGDGFAFLKEHVGEFDVIITDSSDPVGPAENLFKRSYYELLAAALKPGGIIASQASTVWESMPQVKHTFDHCKSVFPVAAYAVTSVPTYPSGQIGFVIGALDNKTKLSEPLKVFSDEDLNLMNMKYYNHDVHKAAFVLPRFVVEAFSAETPENTEV